jgi:hypothetical protein
MRMGHLFGYLRREYAWLDNSVCRIIRGDARCIQPDVRVQRCSETGFLGCAKKRHGRQCRDTHIPLGNPHRKSRHLTSRAIFHVLFLIRSCMVENESIVSGSAITLPQHHRAGWMDETLPLDVFG